MTENSNRPFSGIMVKARPMPNFRYPHFQKWYSTTTWLGSATTAYNGHMVSGGRNFQPTLFAQRLWHVDTPPARSAAAFSTTVAMDLTTPFYMLADTAGGTASTEDTIIGPDYCNAPIAMHQDLLAWHQVAKLASDNFRPIFARVLAIKHTFTFVNNSRFPLEVWYTVLPIGHLFNAKEGAFAPHNDMTTHSYKKIVVPAIRDAGDRSKKISIDLSMSMPSMFPDEYQITPGPEMTSTTAALSVDSRSPWISMDPGATTNSIYRNIPPGQIADDSHSTPDFATTKPTAGLRLQWQAKLQEPRDVGVTTEGSSTGGDYVGNNYDVHAKCSWLVDCIKMSNLDQIHTGEKAYPSTVA